jgi:hypothetical protein
VPPTSSAKDGENPVLRTGTITLDETGAGEGAIVVSAGDLLTW